MKKLVVKSRSIFVMSTLALAVITLGVESLRAQATWGPSGIMGGTAGSSRGATLSCPTGKYAIGIQVYAGTYIHGLLLECATLGPNGEHQSPELVSGIVGWRGAGSLVQRRCADGKVMVGFQGRAALWLDRIQVACKSWNRAGGGTQGTTSWTSSAGGSGGQPYGPISCPGQYGIYRVEGWDHQNIIHNIVVLEYRFSCKAAA